MKQILFFATIFVFMISCKTETSKKQASLEVQPQTLSDTLIDSDCAFLVNSSKSIFLSWTEVTPKGNVLVYKKFNDTVFGKKIIVKPTLGMQLSHESMAKISQTKSGDLFCFFRITAPTKKNKYGGSLYYTVSHDDGETWSQKIKFVKESTSTSQSFFDIVALTNGGLGIVWLDNRFSTKEKRGSTLFFGKTEPGAINFSEKPIAFNTCQCCRTDLFVKNNKLQVAFRNLYENSVRDMAYIYSEDSGDHFSETARLSKDNWEIDGCPHTGPSLAANKIEDAAVWFTAGKGNKGLFFTKKFKGVEEFDVRKEISENGNHPQMLEIKGEFYVVYDEYYTENHTTYQKILLHKINNLGLDVISVLSEEKTKNRHPVITKTAKGRILVAWVNLDGSKKIIQSKIIKI